MVHVLHGRELSRSSMAFGGAIPAGLAADHRGTARGARRAPSSHRAAALVVAAVVTRFTRRVSVVIGAGMATFWVLATQV